MATRPTIPVAPTPDAFRAAVHIYCELFEASETSGFRTALHNKAVGGCPESPHLVGLGVDVLYDTAPPLNTAQPFASALGLAVFREQDHDHLQPTTWPPCGAHLASPEAHARE